MRPDQLTDEEKLVASIAIANHRKENSMEKVQFETNVPISLALKFPKGKPVTSQIDGAEQMMYTTTDGKVMFHSATVAAKIDALGLRPGEPFLLCKREVRNSEGKPRIEWQAYRDGQQAVQAPAATVAAIQGSYQNTPNNGSSQQHTPPQKVPFDRALSLFLVIAGRSTREAEQQLAAEGGSVRFDNRDVAALGTTMFIQAAREGWLTWLEEPKPAVSDQPSAVKTRQTPAQTAVADQKIADLQRKAASSEQPLPKPWTTRGEMKQVFAVLRERIGETRYLQEMRLAGVQSPEQFRYLNDAMACYQRLYQIAQEEAA